MPFYSGSNGQLLIDGQVAARVRSWTYNLAQTTLEATSLADTDRVISEGIRSHTGSCSLWYYASAEGNSASDILNTLVRARTTGSNPGVAPESQRLTLRLKINDQSQSGKYIEGEAVLTSVSMNMAVGEVLAADVSFEFNGAPLAVNI